MSNKHSPSKIIIYFVLSLPGVILVATAGNKFAFPYNSEFSDILITHFPNLFFLKETLINERTIPFWSEQILSGYPFAANPLSGIWYLPTYISLIFPLPLGINILTALHLVSTTIGLYFLLREEGFNEAPSLLGAMIWGLSSKVFAHYGLGHITLLFSISWTPWLLLFESRSLKNEDQKTNSFFTSIIYSLIILADPRWAAYSGLLWLAYSVRGKNNLVMKLKSRNINNKTDIKKWCHWGGLFLYKLLISIFLAAPLIIHFIQYTTLSTRKHISIADNSNLALPLKYLIGFIVPNMGGYGEWVLYSGGLLVVCVVYSLFSHRKHSKENFWMIVFIVSILLSLGNKIPVLVYLYRIPFFSLLRVPSRFLFLSGFSASIIVVYAIQKFFQNDKKSNLPWVICSILGITLFFTSLGLYIFHGVFSINIFWGAISLSFFTLIIWLFHNNKINESILFSLLIIGVFSDNGGVSLSQIRYETKREVFEQAEAIMDYLADDTDLYRIYSPSYSIPQHVASINNLELADGIDPMQFERYIDFVELAFGVPYENYSVTMPPFETGNPATDNQHYLPDPYLLGLLNVKYVVSDFKIELKDLERVDTKYFPYIYRNKEALPRVWIQEPTIALGRDVVEIKEIIKKTNSIEINMNNEGLLVLSEINYPGWKTYIDGIESRIYQEDCLFLNVLVPQGKHKVLFIFRPVYLTESLVLSLCTLIWMALSLVIGKRIKSN